LASGQRWIIPGAGSPAVFPRLAHTKLSGPYAEIGGVGAERRQLPA
jgi:hypothetical protein